MAKPFSELRKKMPLESQRWVEEKVKETLREIRLAELREVLGKTQREIAEKLGVSQAAISQLENQPDMLLKTLEKYVGAMGAELVITARFPEGDVVLDVDKK
jgi:transcriptional regulator with XRE-family HTH domain